MFCKCCAINPYLSLSLQFSSLHSKVLILTFLTQSQQLLSTSSISVFSLSSETAVSTILPITAIYVLPMGALKSKLWSAKFYLIYFTLAVPAASEP